MGYMDKCDHVTYSYSIADGPGNGQISYTFSSGHYHCQQLYHCHLLRFKIVTLTVQTAIGEGPSTSGGKGALTSGCKRKKTAPSTSQLKRLDTRHSKHWLMQYKRIQCHVYSAEIYIRCWEYNIRLCANPCFEAYHTKLHFWGSSETKSGTHKFQQIPPLKLLNWYFSVASSWWNAGSEWGVDFTEWALRRKRDL
jgi:hypothetical protein